MDIAVLESVKQDLDVNAPSSSLWEDVFDGSSVSSTSSQPSVAQHAIGRKRRYRAIFRSSPHRYKSSVKSYTTKPTSAYSPNYFLHYPLEVFIHAMSFLRYPFSALLAFWILSFIVTRFMTNIHASLCQVPGLFNLLPCEARKPSMPLWADYPKLMDVQSASFEQLLEESVGGSELSLEVKKAEIATSDLITLVKFSDQKSRDMMARMLEEFILDAKQAGRSLQRLSSKIGGAVDR